jgi:fatty acid desaturase
LAPERKPQVNQNQIETYMFARMSVVNLTAKTKWDLFSSRALIAAQAGFVALGATLLVALVTGFISYQLEPEQAPANTMVVTFFWLVFGSPFVVMLCAADDWVALGELHKKLNATG